jgi:choline dehydrogenase-like flavoprotein
VHLYQPGGFVHEVGTARMGVDPRTSVLNGYAQCWDAPNVFVMDGAAWPSGAWQNPTFTMMAIAGRASGHLVGELKAGRI